MAIVGSERQLFSWIAPTGLVLVLFLVLHLGGVALAVMNPGVFEAYAMALQGRSYEQILRHYYRGVELKPYINP